MNRRSRTLWIPALATILAASIAMRLLQWAGVRPQLVWTGPVALSFYWIWLGSLPFCGALGAWLSQRAGGSARLRLLSALSPVLWMLGFAVLVEPIELAFNGMRHLVYFGYGATNWIVIPGLALFVGATPFLRQHARVTPTPQS